MLDGRERRGVFSHLSVVFIECTRLFDEWVYMEGEDVEGWEHFLIPQKNGLRFQIFFCVGFHYMYFFTMPAALLWNERTVYFCSMSNVKFCI